MKAERAYPRATVTNKAQAAILRGHPWVYGAEILSVSEPPENGGLVDVLGKKGQYLGTGFWSETSKIQVRLLSRNANDRLLGTAAPLGLGIPQNRSDPRGPGRLPDSLRRGRPVPRPDGG